MPTSAALSVAKSTAASTAIAPPRECPAQEKAGKRQEVRMLHHRVHSKRGRCGLLVVQTPRWRSWASVP